MQEVLGQPHHVGGVVEHHDGRRPEERARLLDASKLAGMSIWSGSRIGTDEPPGMTAFSVWPSRMPPA
jgi:hypothetical protein